MQLNSTGKLFIGGLIIWGLCKFSSNEEEEEEEEENCTPRVFIPHPHNNSSQYKKIICSLEEHGVLYTNYSVPINKRFRGKSPKQIEAALERRIKNCSTVLIDAGMYANREWIKKEVDLAKKYNKKIIAIKPRGNQRIPDYLKRDQSIKKLTNLSAVVSRVSCLR